MNSAETLRSKWARGQVVVSTAVDFADPAVTELMGEAGVDLVFIDLEHGVLSLHQALAHVMVARGQDLPIVIRVPSYDPVVIKPVLELHPAAIVVPRVTSAEEAATAIAGCKYPPKGTRGYGPMRGTRYGAMTQQEFLKVADDQTMVWIQIEDINAVKNLDAILDTPGIDSIMIGPNDLSGTMGMMGRTTEPEVIQAIGTIIEKCKARGIPIGIGSGFDPQKVQSWIEKGLSWMSLNGDWSNLFTATKSMVDQVRQIERSVKS